MIIKEFRVTLPMTLEEYNIALLYGYVWCLCSQ
jgi:hypothetical protein